MKTLKEINFIMTVPISLGINVAMVLKCKLGYLIPIDFSKLLLKQSFFLHPDHHSIVYLLSLGIEATTLKKSSIQEKI